VSLVNCLLTCSRQCRTACLPRVGRRLNQREPGGSFCLSRLVVLPSRGGLSVRRRYRSRNLRAPTGPISTFSYHNNLAPLVRHPGTIQGTGLSTLGTRTWLSPGLPTIAGTGPEPGCASTVVFHSVLWQ